MRRIRPLVYPVIVLWLVAAGCGTDSPTQPERARAKSGSSLFNHIKTFTILHDWNLAAEQIDFIADHFDLFVGGGIDPADLYARNPNALYLSYDTIASIRDDEFGAECPHGDICMEEFAAEHGYDLEDFFLHYSQDVGFLYPFPEGGVIDVSIDGWNPDRQSSDPPASATERSQARVWSWWSSAWRVPNPTDAGWQNWECEKFVSGVTRYATQTDGILVDGVVKDWHTLQYMQYDKTDEYWGVAVDAEFPMIGDTYSFIVVLRDCVCQACGGPKIVAGNASASWYLIGEAANSGKLLERFDWFLIEYGVRYDEMVDPAATCSYEGQYAQALQVRQLAEEGKHILFGAKENSNTDRGRLFVLGTFYLINHPNLYFANHSGPLEWIDAAEYDIGLPEGDAYEWAAGADPSSPTNSYHVMAREYSGALILVKLRDKDSTVTWSASNTTHSLPGTYRPLNADGSLGSPITQVTLRNNEAAILIPE